MTELSSEFVSDFVNSLRSAHVGCENAKHPAVKRSWWIRELAILARMARKVDPAVALFPLYELMTSLRSLELGIAEPPLKPLKLNHRPPDPRWAFFRGGAAAASEQLIRHGARASEADSWVAKRLSKAGYRKPGRTADSRITPVTIKGWRKEARERRPGELVRAAFDSCLEKDPPLENCSPEVAALYREILLDGIEPPANVQPDGILRCLTAIELILAYSGIRAGPKVAIPAC